MSYQKATRAHNLSSTVGALSGRGRLPPRGACWCVRGMHGSDGYNMRRELGELSGNKQAYIYLDHTSIRILMYAYVYGK
jgi:hypothetical protein